MNNKPIYVFGHKNPDTDSVCAAISFSYLKKKLGYNTVPAILGDINQETKYALSYFGFNDPIHLNDVKIQLKDISYHKNCYIDKNSTIKDAFDYMNKYSLTGVGVVEDNNKYYGYISLKEIASEVINGNFRLLDTSYGNIISIIKGNKILKFNKEISGNVVVNPSTKIDNNSILITNDNDCILESISNKVKLIILVSSYNLKEDIIKKAQSNRVNIISTPYNLYETCKLISLSNYIKNFVRDESESITFNEVDYLSDFLDKSKKLKHTNYPIINYKNECCGLLTLTDINQVDKKKVILVDHNNISQSIDGLDEAEILEIIDHHNIGDIVTKKPINFRNSICGCCNTIIYEMFIENNIKIPKDIAGIMCSAIISDTLLLTSPTTTLRDKEALENLSKIAGIDYKKYGTRMLKHGMSIKGLKDEELLYRDFKTYKVDNNLIGIGQLLVADIKVVKNKFDEIVKILDEISKHENYKVLTLFITDFFENKSYCLYNKSAQDIIKYSFNLNKIYEGVMLKGVLSRKIQIAPYIMEALSE